jgi:hypothetical protein
MYLIILLSIARAPQLYIHRSGRTARASSNGVTLSIYIVCDHCALNHVRHCYICDVTHPGINVFNEDSQ